MNSWQGIDVLLELEGHLSFVQLTFLITAECLSS